MNKKLGIIALIALIMIASLGVLGSALSVCMLLANSSITLAALAFVGASSIVLVAAINSFRGLVNLYRSVK